MPTGGPPTTTPSPGAPPPPPPDPTPILTKVDADLAQLTAIDDYEPAQALVAEAQAEVTSAGAALQSARQGLTSATNSEGRATSAKAVADAKLRTMALAAYIGVGYSTPGFGSPPGGNGNQGPGTVSTPAGLTGINELDAKEMLILVGQHARQSDDNAKVSLTDAEKAVARAADSYHQAQAAEGSAEAGLLAAQRTLRQVITAATSPSAAAATPLPNLASLNLQTLGAPAGGGAAKSPPSSSPADHPALQAGAASPVPGQTVYSPPILGPSSLTGADLAAWFASTGRKANTTVPIAELAQDYQTWGQKTGVRYDVAFAQSVIETGYFSFPAYGQLTAQDNNFAGIGACDTCAHGWSFPDASTGVGAQLQLLDAYASSRKVDTSLVGSVGVGGCCTNWMALSGVWASSTVYGISIMNVYHQMLTWLVPRRMVAAGITAAPGQAAQRPQPAPLPGSGSDPRAPAPSAETGGSKGGSVTAASHP